MLLIIQGKPFSGEHVEADMVEGADHFPRTPLIAVSGVTFTPVQALRVGMRVVNASEPELEQLWRGGYCVDDRICPLRPASMEPESAGKSDTG